ncbi:hypothetical protein DL768_004645 [Monosporascus sp. mg162]|nr:hypothetical protein DL768_004645 [Monosporascus sp. mg162]
MSLPRTEDSPASYGTEDSIPRFLPVSPSTLALIFEWAALLPLVIYLAGGHFSYQLVGRTALASRIGTGFFPPLGVLAAISDFMSGSADFIDRACSISEDRRTVWDANWGSVFPCANGSASDILTKQAVRGVPLVPIGEEALGIDVKDNSGTKWKEQRVTANEKNETPKTQHRRYQTLYILDCPNPPQDAPIPRAIPFTSISLSIALESLILLSILGLISLTILYGLYGTAACLVVTFFFRLSRRLVRVTRPGGYLTSNEKIPACMLVAIHENASTWYLYCGSRAVVDTLLNKPMIHSITSPLGAAFPFFLRALGALQLIAMTFVAAQKGWDGVALLALITAAWATNSLCYSEDRLARSWMRREGVSMEVRGYRFGGRTAMLGAIQLLKSEKVTLWMDGILAPSPRREVWLARLSGETDEKWRTLEKHLSEDDRSWLEINTEQSRLAAEIIKRSAGSVSTLIGEC